MGIAGNDSETLSSLLGFEVYPSPGTMTLDVGKSAKVAVVARTT
jgi:hypothetical protein